MANNYLSSGSNPFGPPELEDDIDDELFLRGARPQHRGAAAGSASGRSYAGGSTNAFEEPDFEDPRLLYAQRRREIENRTLDSTEKSLSLLYETEQAGKETAQELAKQREQLERTARHIDDINSTLRFSQRHLNNLKSVFGGLKNYLSGNREQQPPPAPVARLPVSPSDNFQDRNFNDTTQYGASTSGASRRAYSTSADSFDEFTAGGSRGAGLQQQQRARAPANAFDAQLESNLENMCENLSRLKYLATDLGAEIETQNIMLDNMNYKIEDVDIKLRKQNKDINKLLK